VRGTLRRWSQAYGGRLFFYGLATVLGSLVGRQLVTVYDNWTSPSVLSSLYVAVFAFGPALLIAASAKVPPLLAAVIAIMFGSGVTALWWAFASDDSSTSVLAFLSGWWIGIPSATALVVLSALSRRRALASATLPG
jgi:hypothetical protein